MDSNCLKEPRIRWGPDPPMRRGNFEGEGTARCKVYGIPSMRCGDAAFCQITLSTCLDVVQTEDHHCTSTLAVSLGRASLIKPRNELPHVSTRPSRIHRTRVVARATNLGPQKKPGRRRRAGGTQNTPHSAAISHVHRTGHAHSHSLDNERPPCSVSLINQRRTRQPNVFDRKHAHNDTNGTANNHTHCRTHSDLPNVESAHAPAENPPRTVDESENAFPACEIHNATTSFLGHGARCCD